MSLLAMERSEHQNLDPEKLNQSLNVDVRKWCYLDVMPGQDEYHARVRHPPKVASVKLSKSKGVNRAQTRSRMMLRQPQDSKCGSQMECHRKLKLG